ncbi:MAG: hypothetical protein ACXWTX_04910 [Gallionella sp.]
MSQGGLDFLLTIVILMPLAFLVLKEKKKAKAEKWEKNDPRYVWAGKGQIFDRSSIRGNVHSIIFWGVFWFLGWHADEFFRWFGPLLGDNRTISPEKEQWHRMVSTGLGLSLIIFGFLEVLFILRDRRNEKIKKEIEQLRQFHNSHKD